MRLCVHWNPRGCNDRLAPAVARRHRPWVQHAPPRFGLIAWKPKIRIKALSRSLCWPWFFFPVASTLAPARPGWTWQRQETHLIRRRKLLLPPKDGVTRMEACTRDMDHFPQIIAIYSGTCRQPQAHNIPAVSVPTKVTIWQTETYLT